MAKLQDIVANNKKKVLSRNSSGELAETSGEELQGLAQKAGLQAPPVTPLGAMAIGANPDQAKMAGSGAQKKAALTLSQSPQDNLQTVQRQQQARSQATAQESAAREKSENLKALGGLGDRVNDFINVQRQNLSNQAQTQTSIGIKANEDAGLLASLPSDQVDSFKGLLEQFQQNPDNLQLLVDAGNMIGGRAITPEEVAGLYQTAQQSISGAAGAHVADQLTVANLFDDPEFGYDSGSLSQLLGVTPEELSSYTVAQLEEKVDQVTANEFAKSGQVEQQATSSQLGAAERQFARQAGRELSATGVRSSEADMKNLEQQIEAGQEVSFGGKQYDLETLLDDDTFSQVISDYMTNPDSPESQRLMETEPQLLEFIQKNEALFSDAVNMMKTQTTEFGAIQEDNKKLAEVGNTKLDDEIMQALFQDYGNLTTDRLEVDPNSALGYIKQNDANGEIITSQLNDLISKNPEYAQELAGLDAADMQKLGIEKNSPNWNKFKDAVNTNVRLNNTSEDDLTTILSDLIGSPLDQKGAEGFLKESNTRKVLGFGLADPGLLDADGDGKLDNSADILANMKAATPKPSLMEAVAGNISKFESPKLGQPPLSGTQTEIYNRLAKYTEDGKVSAQELASEFANVKSPADINLLTAISRSPVVVGNPANTTQVYKLVDQARTNLANEAIQKMNNMKLPSINQKWEYLQALLDGKDEYGPGTNNLTYIHPSVIHAEIRRLRAVNKAAVMPTVPRSGTYTTDRMADLDPTNKGGTTGRVVNTVSNVAAKTDPSGWKF